MSETTVNDDAVTREPADGNGAGDAAEPEGPADELRESQLAVFTEALGDRVLGSHISPGHELWVRVDRSAWTEAAELAKDRLGCTFFDFLSAVDWLPSPWGRYEDALVDEAGDEATGTDDAPASNGSAGGPDATGGPGGSVAPGATGGGIPYVDPASVKPGVTGGDTRFQMLCRLSDVRRSHSVVLKADLPDDDLRIHTLVGIYAGANWHERECWEMFGITFDGHPGLRHLYLPGAFEGHPLRKDFPLLARLVKPWPGIVDVEPMPASAEPDAAEAAEGEAAEGEGDAAAESEAGDS